ncbi:MAG: hypothetical protein SAK29_41150, partial [Scytonema sp. PMC 1069.18]|nr:hypothetical protein [Scytonema sp. PMC 1069.18]
MTKRPAYHSWSIKTFLRVVFSLSQTQNARCQSAPGKLSFLTNIVTAYTDFQGNFIKKRYI